jgi:hypothetical protein
MRPSFLFFHFSSNQSFARQCRQAQIIVRACGYPGPDQHRLQNLKRFWDLKEIRGGEMGWRALRRHCLSSL